MEFRSESESVQNIFLAENDWRQGPGHDAPFSRIVRSLDVLPVYRVLTSTRALLKPCGACCARDARTGVFFQLWAELAY